MRNVYPTNAGQAVHREIAYYITLPTKTDALAVIESLSAMGFTCHTLERYRKQWFFLANKPSAKGKMDRAELAMVKSLVAERGGDVEGWKVSEVVKL